MKLVRSSSLADVAAVVAAALARSGIRAVLTGGACATLYTGGQYQSSDLDFVLQSAATRRQLDAALETVGFTRKGEHYEHAEAPFLVEFPPGPLGIGADLDIRPVAYRIRGVDVKALSATDSCRDRLAAFYHWHDRQSLMTAVQIARRQRVKLTAVRDWSAREGASAGFEEFLALVRSARRRGSRTDAHRS